MLSIFNTQQVAPHERFSYWAEVICQTFFQVDCRRPEHVPLHGEMASTHLDDLELVDIVTPAMEYTRGPAQLARISGEGAFLMVLNLSGTGYLEQHGKQTRIMPGDVALWSTVAPSHLSFQQPTHKITVIIPARQMYERIACAEDALALSLSGGSALGAMVGSLIRESHALAQREGACGSARLSSGMLDIVSFAFDPQRERMMAPARKHPLERIKRHLLEHLGDPQLCLADVANLYGISTRTLNRLFAAEGTTAHRWLWCKRLDASRKLLEQGQARQVSEAALSCGFNDLSHFCKAFKAAYGVRPSQCLQHASGTQCFARLSTPTH